MLLEPTPGVPVACVPLSLPRFDVPPLLLCAQLAEPHAVAPLGSDHVRSHALAGRGSDEKPPSAALRLRTSDRARERLGEGARLVAACPRPEMRADFPLRRGTFTPARRAFDKPIAMACLADRAPCLPFRICLISSRTNSPACVVGAFPARLAFLARLTVFFSGIVSSKDDHKPSGLFKASDEGPSMQNRS